MKLKLHLYLLTCGLALLPWAVSADTNLSNFVEYTGEAASDFAGDSVATGDVNNDGYDDMLIGVVGNDDGGSGAGAVYLIYGQSSALSSSSLSTWIEFTGEAAGDSAGESVATGDINNDGYDDMLIGASSNDDGGSGAGAVYLIYGQSSALSSSSLSTWIEFTGEAAGDSAGSSVATGDVNNDGYDDMVIGAKYNTDGGSLAGAAYVIYGKSSLFSSGSLSTRKQFTGEAAGDEAGIAIATGDVNNDGYDDILVGADRNDDGGSSAGAVYLIIGQSSLLSSGSLSTRTQFAGEAASDFAGNSVATGDINNDGYDDMLIGAAGNDDGGSGAGAMYLIYGESGIFSSGSLSTRTQFTGEASGDDAGWSVTSGDVNNDGYDDFLIGAIYNDDATTDAGATYLIYGKASAFSSGSLSARTEFTGEAGGDWSGFSLAVGDMNNDNYGDIVLGGYQNDDGGTNAGAAYLGYLYIDADGDGVTGTSGVLAIGSDCNDTDATVSADQTYYQDADGDGLGSDTTTSSCSATAPTGYVSNSNDTNDTDYDNDGVSTSSDCDDTNSALSASQTYYQDADGDGLGSDVTSSVCSLTAPSGYVSNSNDTNDSSYDGNVDIDGDGVASTTDCDDTNSAVSSNQTYYRDGDGDGYGTSATTTSICSATAPTGYVSNSTDANDSDYDNDGVSTSSDCDDTNSALSVSQTYYQDADGDGLGNSAITTATCSLTPPSGYVLNAADTDDTTASTDSDTDDDGVDVTTDCNDADATVSAYQTYYRDADEDGYGNPDLTTSVCSSTAPSGYVANDLDGDDSDSTVVYENVEFQDDGIDNDGDGEIDEYNTLGENGPHPVFSDDDVTQGSVYSASITDIVGTKNGNILVTYTDNSVYRYSIYTLTTSKDTLVQAKPGSSLAIVVQPKARKISLVNALSGEILHERSLNTKTSAKVQLRIKDIRSDGKYEAVVVSKRKTNIIHVHLISIKVSTLKLKKRDHVKTINEKVAPQKTKVKEKSIRLRSKQKKVILKYKVTTEYQLRLV